MNDINTTNQSEYLNKSNKWNKLPYTLLLATLLSLNNPSEAKDLNTYNSNLQNVEVVSDSGIVANVERRTGVKLPALYASKVRNFVINSKVVEGSGAEFTEDFIINQMKSNWGVSKQNQLLFIWDAVYEQITKKNFYDGEDGDSNRLSEFESAMDSVEVCGKRYKEQFTSYMKGRSSQYKQESAEADRRSSQYKQESAEATYSGLIEMIRFYNLYKKNPSSVRSEELNQAKEHSKWIIESCKKYNIDYKAKLSKEILKFYSVE